MLNRHSIFYLISALGIIWLLVLCLYNPEEHSWFPKCTFFALTGLKCPSCGSQRTVHALLCGEWSKALMYNPFLVVSLPYFASVVYTTVSQSRSAQAMRRFVQGRTVVNIYLTLLIIWWIVRNLCSL